MAICQKYQDLRNSASLTEVIIIKNWNSSR